MHESSLGKQLLEAILSRARDAGATRVVRARGWIAETESLDPAAIAFHFGAHAKGTAAEGAELDLDLRWVDARCKRCSRIYRPEHHLTLCPACGHTDGDLLGETGVAINSIDVE